MEVIEKRTFNEDGDLAIAADIPTPQLVQLAEVPRVYASPKPLRDFVFIKQASAETTYAGQRFVIPDAYQQAPNMGVVVAVGPWIRDEFDGEKMVRSADLNPGDIVTFSKFNAEPIQVSNEVFMLVSIHDVKVREEVSYAVLS